MKFTLSTLVVALCATISASNAHAFNYTGMCNGKDARGYVKLYNHALKRDDTRTVEGVKTILQAITLVEPNFIESCTEQIRLADEEREAMLKRPYPKIGMTSKQVVEASNWGEPSTVNTTRTAKGVREQWVYNDSIDGFPSKYLYFTNGKLTAIQD